MRAILFTSRVRISIDDKFVTTGEFDRGFDFMRKSTEGFDAWVGLSGIVKGLIGKGLINLDLIREESLLSVVIAEARYSYELSSTFKKIT